MNDRTNIDQTRLLELLAEQAACGLSAADHAELARLLQQAPAFDADVMDQAAATVELSMLASVGPGALEEMPEALRRKIADAAAAHVLSNAEAHQASLAPDVVPAQKPPERKPLPVWTWWTIAAALLVASGLLVVLQSAWEASPIEEYRQMMASGSPDVVRSNWIDPAAAAETAALGDVVWNVREQRGYMRFRGLAVNDPTKEQYQLWIFDRTRDERFPVDGGVFDIVAAAEDPATGDVIVPIRARLPIKELAMFAVTIEQPGGVVVSSRERLPRLAKIE